MSPLDNSASWFDANGSLLIDAPDAGWTSYLPQLGNRSSRSVSLDFQPAVAWHILDSGALNFLVTILRMNRYGVYQMPLFCWSMSRLRTGTGYDAGTGRVC